jgi:gas vesicle protein GvpL/GvpF
VSKSSESYVYGVSLPEASPPKAKGIGGRKLRLVDAGPLAAIVSDATPPVRAGRQELAAHARVLQRALGNGPVLPMRFGVVMPGDDAVREELLEPFREVLIEQLGELEGTVELHLRATYDEPALMKEVLAGDRRIAALSRSLRGQSPDATYYEQIELGERVAQAVEDAAARDRAALLGELEPLCLAVSVGDPQHEQVACDAAFLVEDARLAEFDRAVDELGLRHDGRIRFTYTGPHPPYNFVELPAQV